ncbi:carboxymuconolactone decarboxylase family protein [Rhizobium sp. L1K21]|uniref:carboxymuconolactone decarboxylase family protein n=1 Tax=Rhizobium sp. L1K21 TaxID=2954933 RepID=UPI002093D57E|nr:carboxymuconolactone decarboxylase family protein [Rhizobium sp. L1K21]MCO6188425.1 carboxymuconolactone decarboxylase family protein [Rhizobium sp. L1K21]
MTSRISFPSPEAMSEAQLAVFKDIVSGPRGMLVGPLKAALHNPVLADRWQKFGQVLRYETSLPFALNEIAILATARHWSCLLEFAIHRREARRAGVAETLIEALRCGERPAFGGDPAAAEIYEYTRQLLTSGDVSDAAHLAVRQRWGETGVVELTAVVGYYSLVAMTLNAHRVPLPEGLECELPNVEGGIFYLPALHDAVPFPV